MNPLALLADGSVVPLDSKVTIDDNALYRHPDLAALRAEFPVDPTQALANEKGLQYVKLDGDVGIIGNGAGLVMSTLDVVSQAGGKPANFLDFVGGASAESMATSLEVVLADPAVRSVLVNIFGGITRGELVARGMLERSSASGDGADRGASRRNERQAAHPRGSAPPTDRSGRDHAGRRRDGRRARPAGGGASDGDPHRRVDAARRQGLTGKEDVPRAPQSRLQYARGGGGDAGQGQ